jgi:amidophosphoribosyltransferase
MARCFDETAPMPAGDVLHEACGVTGVFARGQDVARLSYFGLYALQHRGQESAGIAVGDGEKLYCHRQMGLISQVFDEGVLSGLNGHISVGHTRYSTSGSSIVANAQPLMETSSLGEMALAHNGNITNPEALRQMLSPETTLTATSDTEVLSKLLVETKGDDWVTRIKAVMEVAQGAYSVVMATPNALYAFRDPWGVRPLCLGRYADGYMVASESCALATVGAVYDREIEPGEILEITDAGIRSIKPEAVKPSALCMFEYIYFARPDSVLDGHSIYMTRQRMGRQLAIEHPVEADVVMAIPDSAVPGGIGYANESGIPYVEGLIKNRYIGRTFIHPNQKMRNQGVQLKFNPIVENIRGKRIIVVDDSIVRGTTTPRIVALFREAGALEVHVRITSPPIIHPCYLGVDMASYDELIAANLTIDQIRVRIGADSLGYLSKEGLVASTNRKRADFCLGCLTGEYPNTPVRRSEAISASCGS